ncbi:hypothetical protein ACES2L_15250 [Bdellovibrio bacteriovorus]
MKINTLIFSLLCFFGTNVWAQAPLITITTTPAGERIVADSIGKTLYIFEPDIPSKMPTCYGVCAEDWPPYLLTDAEAASLSAPLGVVMRTTNRKQLTYDGLPVYTYAFDRVMGDNKGDGVGGVWHDIELGSQGK